MSDKPQSPKERRDYYLKLAAEAEANAARAGNAEVKEHYRRLAEGWRSMAATLDKQGS